MPIIYTYPDVDAPVLTDLLILSDTSDKKATKKSTIADVVRLGTINTVGHVIVSATYGAGQYTATVGSITALSRSVVYDITFNVTNSVSPVNLVINGLIGYPLQHGTGSGWIDIPIGGLTPGATYYLVWDGDRFQVNESDPTSPSTIEFVNPAPVTAAHGGITAGQTFERKDDDTGYSLQEMFDIILYPYQSPALSNLAITGQGPTVEVGYTVPSGPKTFTWSRSNSGNIEANSGVVTDITAGTILATGVAIDSTTSGAVTLPLAIQKTSGSATHQWKISGTNNQGGSIPTSTYTITWLWKRYVGNDANTTINEAQLEALSVNSSLATSLNGTYVFPGGNYKYLCVPTTFAEPSAITSGGFPVAMAGNAEGYTNAGTVYDYDLVSVTNTNAQTINYRVYRSLNILNGSATFIVS